MRYTLLPFIIRAELNSKKQGSDMSFGDGIRTDSLEFTLVADQEKTISLKDHIILDVLKFIAPYWMGAEHDIRLFYSEDLKTVTLRNMTGSTLPLPVKVRLIKFDGKRER